MSLGLDEEKAKERDAEREVDAHYNKARLIWVAFLASLVVVFIVTRLVKSEHNESRQLFWILLALGVFNIGASFFLKHRMLKAAVTQRKPGFVPSAYLIALALCESTGLYGVVAHFATGVEQYYFLFVLGGFGMLLHKPQRDDVVAAAAGPGGLWETKRKG